MTPPPTTHTGESESESVLKMLPERNLIEFEVSKKNQRVKVTNLVGRPAKVTRWRLN